MIISIINKRNIKDYQLNHLDKIQQKAVDPQGKHNRKK